MRQPSLPGVLLPPRPPPLQRGPSRSPHPGGKVPGKRRHGRPARLRWLRSAHRGGPGPRPPLSTGWGRGGRALDTTSFRTSQSGVSQPTILWGGEWVLRVWQGWDPSAPSGLPFSNLTGGEAEAPTESTASCASQLPPRVRVGAGSGPRRFPGPCPASSSPGRQLALPGCRVQLPCQHRHLSSPAPLPLRPSSPSTPPPPACFLSLQTLPGSFA